MTFQYHFGYAVGFFQKRIKPRMSLQFWLGYLAGMMKGKAK